MTSSRGCATAPAGSCSRSSSRFAAAFAYAVARRRDTRSIPISWWTLPISTSSATTSLRPNPQRDAQLLEVESQAPILTSRNVLQRVIDELRLADDPEFVRPTFLDGMKTLIAPRDAKADKELAAMRALSERVEARREEVPSS